MSFGINKSNDQMQAPSRNTFGVNQNDSFSDEELGLGMLSSKVNNDLTNFSDSDSDEETAAPFGNRPQFGDQQKQQEQTSFSDAGSDAGDDS